MLLLLATSACGDQGTGPDIGADKDCSYVGVEHTDAVEAAQTWRKEDGPHHVKGSIRVGGPPLASLTIEAGTLVCFGPGASIVAAGAVEQRPGGGFQPATGGVLIAQGTEDEPIVFTASNPLSRWAGITVTEMGSGSRISHAVVEHATIGVLGSGAVDIDHVTFRQILQTAITYSYYNVDSRIGDTVVDSAGLDGSPAVVMGGGTLERTTIKNSGGTGLTATARYAHIRIQDCSIQGNAGDGVYVTFRTVTELPIHNCNLEDNQGLGVNNASTLVVDATRNWWGDPTGPLGFYGDGVSDGVDYSSHQTEPVPVGNP